VKELRSGRQFVVLGKDQHFSWHSVQKVPSGSINVANNKIQLTGKNEVQTMPIKSTADVLDLRPSTGKSWRTSASSGGGRGR